MDCDGLLVEDRPERRAAVGRFPDPATGRADRAAWSCRLFRPGRRWRRCARSSRSSRCCGRRGRTPRRSRTAAVTGGPKDGAGQVMHAANAARAMRETEERIRHHPICPASAAACRADSSFGLSGTAAAGGFFVRRSMGAPPAGAGDPGPRVARTWRAVDRPVGDDGVVGDALLDRGSLWTAGDLEREIDPVQLLIVAVVGLVVDVRPPDHADAVTMLNGEEGVRDRYTMSRRRRS